MSFSASNLVQKSDGRSLEEAVRECFSGEPSLGNVVGLLKNGESEKALSAVVARLKLFFELPVMSARIPVLVAARARDGP
jgi:hypothetical protein